MPVKAGWQDGPSRSGNLTEAISIASTSLQQRKSISPASFLQCPHLHQSGFNESAAELWICLVSFYGGEWWRERLHCHM